MAPDAQDETARRTWAIDTMLAAHPDMARATAEAIYHRVAARIAPASATTAASATIRPVRLRRTRAVGHRKTTLPQPRIALAMASLGIALAVVDIAWRIVGLS